MIIHDFEQLSDEWFAFRAGKFSASKIADIMRKGRGGKPSTMRANAITKLALERLTGLRDDTYQNNAMQRGTELEPEARNTYSFQNGIAVQEIGCAQHDHWEVAICSPDGLVGDKGALEIKCPETMPRHYAALNGERQNVKEYHWQLQHQLFVTGREWVDLVSYDPRFPAGLQMAVARVEPDAEAQEQLREAITQANIEVEAQLERLRQLQQAAA